jgi:hypothetical protein
MLNGVVYKLKSKNPNITEFYIGSSCDMKKRIASHKSACNNPNSIGYNLKVYKFIRNNDGFDNWEFEILLEVKVVDKEELRLKYERPYQLDLLPELNDRVEGRTIEEWREDNKEELAKYQKKWYEDNKEEIKEKYENNKETILEYQKIYNEKNKVEIAKYQKIYNENHKEELLEKAKEKILCEECGVCYTKSNKTTHLNSKKHKDYIKSLETIL